MGVYLVFEAVKMAGQLDALALNLVLLQRHDVVNGLPQAESRDVLAELAGLDLRVVQQVL